jgi:hypothetical protein
VSDEPKKIRLDKSDETPTKSNKKLTKQTEEQLERGEEGCILIFALIMFLVLLINYLAD